ncbi:MAG: triose-phosphate isomerase [Thermodesulfobacteriota bacterium]
MKKLMAANWKMYKTRDDAGQTARGLVGLAAGRIPADREILVIPPFTALSDVARELSGIPGFFLGAQNFYPSAQGAFTGEIAPDMLLDLGCAYALAGHSERRHILSESDGFVGQKVAFGLAAGLRMILCVGEKIEERKAGKVTEVVRRQLDAGLSGVAADVASETLVVAYEPVWAIGTGLTAGPADIAEAHGFVRELLRQRYGDKGNEIRILYGGSIKPENSGEIIVIDNVDGVLVGGASLRAESFAAIALA